MDNKKLVSLLESVKTGAVDIETAKREILSESYEELGFAKVDHQRKIRQGFPEVIYGAGKTSEQILAIAQSLVNNGEENILCTRLSSESSSLLANELQAIEYQSARIAVVNRHVHEGIGEVLVCCAGTSDLPVAEEAAITAEVMGAKVNRVYDAGVAGLHRLLAHTGELRSANIIIAVAGMEGALPSVLAGLTDRPVIAVPTSVGYGASFGGIAALLAMLNSCASGVTVVNIDNGFGAGYFAALVNKRSVKGVEIKG